MPIYNPKQSLSRATMVAKNNQTTIPAKQGLGLADYTKIEFDFIDHDDENACDLTDHSIQVPEWAEAIQVIGHLTYPAQNVAVGQASIHLWRGFDVENITPYGEVAYAGALTPDYTPRPTPEMHYHNRVSYDMETDPNNYVSLLAFTPWIALCGKLEKWWLYGWQSTGATVVSADTPVENWLSVEFK